MTPLPHRPEMTRLGTHRWCDGWPRTSSILGPYPIGLDQAARAVRNRARMIADDYRMVGFGTSYGRLSWPPPASSPPFDKWAHQARLRSYNNTQRDPSSTGYSASPGLLQSDGKSPSWLLPLLLRQASHEGGFHCLAVVATQRCPGESRSDEVLHDRGT